MKRKFYYVAGVLLVSAVAVLNVKMVLEANQVCDLTQTSIDALSENGGDGETDKETGAHITNKEKCHEQNGYWDMALVCPASGIERVTCSANGEISFLGFVIKGSYTKGGIYPIMWERWECTTSVGNCCLSEKQGLRIK